MDDHRFDALARRWAERAGSAGLRSRRSLLRAGVAGLAAALGGARVAGAQAACRRLGRTCDASSPCCGDLACVAGRCLPAVAACVRHGGACAGGQEGQTCCPGTRCAGGVCCPGPLACGSACCANGTLCRNGVCASPGGGAGCPPGQTRCGIAGCRDLSTDPANCGSCGRSCPGGVCSAGTCGAVLTATGGACTAAGECASGACVDNVCCAEASCAGLAGACQIGVCEAGSGLCVARPKDDGAPCDDGDACTVDDACQDGACVGVAVVCPPPRPCYSGSGSCIPGSGGCDEAPLADGTACAGGVCVGGQCCLVYEGENYDCDPLFGSACITEGPLCCPLTGERCAECYEIYGPDGNLDDGLCCPPELQCGAGVCCWFGKSCIDTGGGVLGCVDAAQICDGGVYCATDTCCGGACCGAAEVCTAGACVPYGRPCDQCTGDESCVGITYEEDGNGDLQVVNPGSCCPSDMVFGTGNTSQLGPVDACCQPRTYACQGVTCIDFDDDFLTCSNTSLGFVLPRR